MSQIMGAKVALKLEKPERCRVLFHILLDGEVIGDIELDQIAWRSGEAELRIEIFDNKWHGEGYGTDAVLTLLNHAFVTMNLSRVYLRVHATNEIALRCYEKAGFKKEGKLKRLNEDNVEEEIFLMGITKARFENQNHPWAV